MIGREPGIEILGQVPTVSRRQARLARTGTGYELENLSSNNPVELDGRVVAAATPVGDGSSIRVGGDRIGGPRCNHCGRENKCGDKGCWYCGTSLVNALRGVRTRRRVLMRLVDAAGAAIDLVEGETLQIGVGGGLGARLGGGSIESPGWSWVDATSFAVDDRAVATAEILNRQSTGEGAQAAVSARDGRVVQDHVAARATPDRHLAVDRGSDRAGAAQPRPPAA
ncbi:MAG: FHA domain-containing protein [Chloroflexi bacterium]|nr:FHA domain-containing protein [Chloroflexota bacterium]